jgi:hypothetical protein
MFLTQDFRNHLPMYVGQSPVHTRSAKRQSLMINPQQVQYRGVQVVTVRSPFRRLISEVVTAPPIHPRPDSRTSKPRHKRAAIVVSPDSALSEGSAAKFRCPDQQSISE